MNNAGFERWLPIGFRFNLPTPLVTWLDFGSKQISEPFYDQTIRNLRSLPLPDERVTGIEELLEMADAFPQIDPAGIIFHISRCGSTLLTNTLRAGGECTALSEPHVINCLVRETTFPNISIGVEGIENIRARLLRAVVSLYTACFGLQVVIKAHTASILHISRLRSVWPSVPFIVNIRDPIEVMASNLARPTDWLQTMLSPYSEENVFGYTGPETRQMSVEEYCARGLGKFFEAANAQIDERCWVLDYKDMNLENIYRTAQVLGVVMPETHKGQILSMFLTYSKDSEGMRAHEDDRDRKQRDSPASVHSLATQWALGPYRQILQAPTVLI